MVQADGVEELSRLPLCANSRAIECRQESEATAHQSYNARGEVPRCLDTD